MINELGSMSIHLADRRLAMRNDEHRAGGHHPVHRLGHKPFRFCIKSRCRLVQDQYGRVLQHGASYCDTLQNEKPARVGLG